MDIFKKGVAVSTWQCAPDDGLSNWSQWAKSRWPFNWFGMKRVKDSIDDTPDFWNRCCFGVCSEAPYLYLPDSLRGVTLYQVLHINSSAVAHTFLAAYQVQRRHRERQKAGMQFISTFPRSV